MPNHHNAQSDNASELAALETRLIAATEMWRDAHNEHSKAQAIAHNKHLEMIAEKDPEKKMKLKNEWNNLYAKEEAALALSKTEIFYPDDSRANEYTYVRKETEPREKTAAEILFDNPTSNPKK